MDKNFKKKFFFICLGGGILFAITFFFVFGDAIGYPWYWALICLGGGLFWAVAFYFIWIIVEKFQKPLSFENPRAQKKLSDYETLRGEVYEHKLFAYMNYGKGLKQEICETYIYFEKEKIHIAFCHFGKIYSFDIPYETIEKVFIRGGILVVHSSEIGNTAYSIKNVTPRLNELLIEKGLYHEASSQLTGKLFITNKERVGTAYFEFQYCKKESFHKKIVEKENDYWAVDSLLVHIADEEEFFENYGVFLKSPNGIHKFDYYGITYYAKEQTKTILEKIKEDKPKEFEVLIAWLEKAVTDYNGFYFLGI